MKRGRKALKDRAAVKTKWIKVRVTYAEREHVKVLADQRGMTVTDMIREFLFKEGGSET